MSNQVYQVIYKIGVSAGDKKRKEPILFKKIYITLSTMTT